MKILLSVSTLLSTLKGYFARLFGAKLPGKGSEITDESKKRTQEAKAEKITSDAGLAAIQFKDPTLSTEFETRPAQLKSIIRFISGFCWMKFRKKITITRVLEKIEGSSGVHEAGRAVDIRDEFQGKSTFTSEEVETLLLVVNRRYPRSDGKPVMIHHSFEGGPKHLHVQIPVEWA